MNLRPVPRAAPYYFDKKTKTATLMFPEPTDYPSGDGERFMAVTEDGTKLVMMYPSGEYEVLRESPDGRLQDGDFLDNAFIFWMAWMRNTTAFTGFICRTVRWT